MHTSFKLSLVALALAAPPSHAQAQTAASDVTLTGSVTGISQYRLRGVSVSDEKPALQASVTAAHSTGAFVFSVTAAF